MAARWLQEFPAHAAGGFREFYARGAQLVRHTLSLDAVHGADLNSAIDKILAEIAVTLEEADQAHRPIVRGGLHGKIVLVP